MKGYKKDLYIINLGDDLSSKKKDITKAEDELNKALHDCNLDSKVTVDEVKRWMQDLDFEDKMIPITMLTGLLDDPVVEQLELVENLLNATIHLNQAIPLPSLNGRSYIEELDKRNEQNIITQVSNSQLSIPPRDWFKPYHKALHLMHQQEFTKAGEKFDETFQKLLDSKTSDPNIYRVFCNAGLGYLFSGRPYLGTSCLNIATEINPNYTFASEQLRKLEQGKFDELMELGIMMNMNDNIEKWEHRPNHLNLDMVMNWSEKKIVKKLSSFGITVDKDEFIRMAKTVNKPDDIARNLFYQKASDDSEDADFFWMAAYALWEKYCPDEQSIDGFNTLIHDAYEYILKIDVANTKNKALKTKEKQEVQTYVEKIKKYVYSTKKDVLHDWNHTLDIDDSAFKLREFLFILLSLADFKQDVLNIVHHLIDYEPDTYWEYINIMNQLQEDEEKGRKLFEKNQKKYPYDCYLACDIGLYYLDIGRYDTAETYFMDAVSVIDKRAEDKAYDIDSLFSTIYEDYTTVLDHLEELYKTKKPSTKQKGWLKNKRKQIEKNRKELSYSPRLEKMDEMMEDLIQKDQEAKVENSYSLQYYDFLSQFNINFETDESVEVTETYLPITEQSLFGSEEQNPFFTQRRFAGKKIGRNDLCPCGSGKKYKKCCGSLTKK